jgi:GTPase SAR1 family protein
MPLPFIIGGTLVLAGAAGAIGLGASSKRLRGRSILIVGPSGAGKTSLVRVFSDNEVIVRPTTPQRWREKAARLVDLGLTVESLDTSGGDAAIDAIRAGGASADVVCLVLSAAELASAGEWHGAARLAKLIGEAAGKRTRSVIVLSRADEVSSEALEELLTSPDLVAVRDFAGASEVHACDLTDRGSWSTTAEAVLSAFEKEPSSRKDQR